MYDRNVAITGSTIEKTTRYDRFREDNIRRSPIVLPCTL